MTDRTRERMRWRCRRGMLELDLVLSAFAGRHLDDLDNARLDAFNRLLLRTDPDLLDLVMGRDEGGDAEERDVLALMRTTSCNERTIQPENPAITGS